MFTFDSHFVGLLLSELGSCAIVGVLLFWFSLLFSMKVNNACKYTALFEIESRRKDFEEISFQHEGRTLMGMPI
jgi:hypothetical protein